MRIRIVLLIVALFPVLAVSQNAQAQQKKVSKTSGPAASDWPAYGRDPGGSRFFPLTQINRDKVKNLKVAWIYRTGDLSDGQNARSSSAFQCTPLLVDGTLYLVTPFNRVIALDPVKGTERWVFDPKIELKRPYDNQLNSRGVSTWLDPQRKDGQPCRRRIVMGTNDSRLIALDAATGKRCEDFGAGGDVDLAG